tara:strand:- start:310 stop:501 length:192 start_codon:yes stop_codon:yes gene_type:complete
MGNTPLIERIERWLLINPFATRILIHEKDAEEAVKQKLHQVFQLPFKVIGKIGTFGGKADGSL